MIRKRILSLLVCAALLCGVLAGCSTSSGSTAASSSSASASESLPSSTVTADTGKVGPLDAGENSLFSLSDPDDAFAPCLGWGPGVSGCSLKSVIAAASLLKWADGCNMSIQPVRDIKDAYNQWFDSLSADDQQSFTDAWPLIKADAETLLTDKDSMPGRIEEAGLDDKDLPGCYEESWNALAEVIFRVYWRVPLPIFSACSSVAFHSTLGLESLKLSWWQFQPGFARFWPS